MLCFVHSFHVFGIEEHAALFHPYQMPGLLVLGLVYFSTGLPEIPWAEAWHRNRFALDLGVQSSHLMVVMMMNMKVLGCENLYSSFVLNTL